MPTGVISPPPMPCTIRKTTSCSTDCARPHAAEAMVNNPTASRNTSRAPNRSPNQPATGMATATATRNPMFTVAVNSIGTPNSAAMVGSATLTTVASMMLMNIAATKTIATAVFGLILAIATPSSSPRPVGVDGAHPAQHHAIGRRPRNIADIDAAGSPVDARPTMGGAPHGQIRRGPVSSTSRSSQMTDLDLGSSATPTGRRAVPRPAVRLVLTPPAPVQVVAPEQAAGAVPVADARQAELQSRAASFAIELASIDVRSPEFAKKVESITSLGDREMRESANVSSRMLERPAAALNSGRAAAARMRRPGSRARWPNCG